MVHGYNIGARNQLADSGAYKFHIHRAYVIYATIDYNYTPYGCETAARAFRFVVDPTVSILVSALLKFSFVNDSNARQFLS